MGKPDAVIFTNAHKEFMRATVRGDCGNVELTVDNPKKLWESYTKAQNA